MWVAKTPDSRRSNSIGRAARRFSGGWRRLGVVATALAVGAMADAASSQDQFADCDSVDCLAQRLIAPIPPDETIALIPLWAPKTSLSEQDATRLYDSLFKALGRASGGQHNLVKRDRFYDDIWKSSKWEVVGGNYQDYVYQFRASVVIHCKDQELRDDKLRLTCTTAGVSGSSGISGKNFSAEALLPVDTQFFQYEYMLRSLANELAAGKKKPKNIRKHLIVDTDRR